MVDRNPRDGGPDPDRSRWARLSRSLAFWALLILVPLILIQLINPGRQEVQEFNYTEFVRQLESGNVLRVTVIDGRELEGELRSSVTVSGEEVQEFWARLPVKDSEQLLERLESSGVLIEAEEA